MKITWIIGKLESRLIGDLPGVEFIIFDKKGGFRAFRQLRAELAGRRFDALLHMQVALRANLVSALIPANIRVGYDRARSRDYHRAFINRSISPTPRQHVRDGLASFLEPLGLQPAPPLWRIPTSDADEAFAREHLDPNDFNIVFSPCASHKLRNWLPERYAQLADYAIEKHNAVVTFVGSPAPFEKDFVADIESRMRCKARNLVGQDTLKQLTRLLANADLVVAPDTGPTHIASAVGTDVLGLYAGSNPDRSGPYNSLQWCVNRYPEALKKFRGKSIEECRWGAKAEFPGAMELITAAETEAMLDRWVASNRAPGMAQGQALGE